ncbi:MAG: methytransferase partner Trm112 [Candidatus Bathyarchaeia archaeon]
MKEELMEILACPICKHHPLELKVFQSSEGEIVEGIILCHKCGRWYPVIDEIPHMLPDDLREESEDKAFLERWRTKIPERVLREGKPYSLGKA